MTADQIAQLTLLTYAGVGVALLLRSKRRCRDGWKVWLLYLINRLYVGLLCHWRANGRCPYPDSSGALILSNHRAAIDPMLTWMNHHMRYDGPSGAIRVIGYLMAREYYETPGLVGWIGRAMQSIPVDRDGRDVAATREALRRLERGDLIGIFPEGGINTGDGLRAANPGVAFLALKSNVPIIPAYIQGVPQSDNMMQALWTPSRIKVLYGRPLDLSLWRDQKRSPELLQALTDTLMQRLADLGGVTYHAEWTR